MRFRLLVVAVFGLGLLRLDGTCAAERYVAWLADGTRLTSGDLSAWPLPGTAFRFSGEELITGSNSVRLLLDRQRVSELNGPCIVFANGDVLPATPVELAAGGRVRVTIEPPLIPANGAALVVRSERIRRIVKSASALAREPAAGTVVMSDGRRLVARSIRWRERGLAVLTSDGVVEAPFAELADVVFPNVELTRAVLEDNLWADLGEGPAIVRMQATNGAVLTAARVRRDQQQDVRRPRASEGAVYYLQPAWAEQPLALPEQEIAACGYRAGDEAPLSAFPASAVFSRQAIGRAGGWTVNRSGDGGLLAARNRHADLSVATRSESAIAFELPSEARSLSLAVGIDRAMGDGGCVRCKVVAGEALWDSGVIQGKDGVKESGSLDVAGQGRVQLVTEFAHDERPAGADPFDIRDQVVWLSPLVKLDLSGSANERAASILAGLNEWQLTSGDWSQLELGSRWSELADQWDAIALLPKDKELVLRRRLRVSRTSDVVELLTVSPTDLDEHDFELAVDGQVIAWRNNADRNQLRQWMLRYARTRARDREEETNLTERLAYWWDLSPWRGREVELRLTLRGKNERNEIAWRSLSVRSALANLPESGEPLVPDVRLTALEPVPGGSDKRGARPAAEEPIRLLGQEYTDGISLARDSRVVYLLKPEYQSLVAIVGCTTQVAGPVQVLIDDGVVWERAAINSLNPAEQISITIPRGAKTLSLVNGADGLFYGYVAFAEAGFTVK
jgi:hypothetical protein